VRAVVQRVKEASVNVAGSRVAQIEHGLLVFLGVGQEDTAADADYLADKIAHLRIFADEQGKMNLSVKDVEGSILAVSQFTLYGDCRRGRRPSFSSAAPAGAAEALYEKFLANLKELGVKTAAGIFQADMAVKLLNDGPVTILLDSQGEF